MKKVLTIISVLFIVVFLAGCGQKSVIQTQPTTPTPVAQQPATKTQTATLETSQITKQSVPIALDSDKSFDMVDVDKNFNPCFNTFEEADPTTSKRVEDFYNALNNNDLNVAISLAKINSNRSLVAYLFPICSAMYFPLDYKIGNGGIIMIIKAGNGYPSIPNDSYSFAYAWASDGKIFLREKIISHYFDSPLGKEYDRKLNSEDNWSEATKILDQLEADAIEGLKNDTFENPLVQAEYNEFISNLK